MTGWESVARGFVPICLREYRQTWDEEKEEYSFISRPPGFPGLDEHGLENVLVHLITMTGEWLYTGIHMECDSILDVQAWFYWLQCDKLPPYEYWELVWGYGCRGPFPPYKGRMNKDRNESYVETVSFLGEVTGLQWTEDRQVFITCIRRKTWRGR